MNNAVKPSILVVDDEPSFRSVIVDFLLEEGYLAIGAESAEKGLSLMGQGQYGIVFSDIHLPGMNGLSFLKEIKKRSPDVEVVMMSGHGTFNFALDALRCGAYDYVVKPLSEIELVLMIVRRVSDKIGLEAEKKRLVEELQESNRRLEESHIKIVQYSEDISALYVAEKELLSGLDLVEVFRRTTNCLSRLVGFYPAIIWTYSESLDTLIPQARSGLDQMKDQEWVIPLTGQISRPTQNMVAHLEETFASIVSAGSVFFQPILGRDKPFGFLSIVGDKKGIFSLREREILSRFSTSVAMAIENANLYQEVKALSIRDGLTGLYNRRHFEEVLGTEGFRSVRYQHPVSLIFLDVDHFKTYNDTYGHLCGDEVLKQIATLIVKRIRVADIACRYGGEEFTIVLPDTDTKNARSVAEDIRIMVASYPFPHVGQCPGGSLTISAGISECPTDGKSLSDIVAVADKALYRAKLAGRNKVCCA